jgi:HIT domain
MTLMFEPMPRPELDVPGIDVVACTSVVGGASAGAVFGSGGAADDARRQRHRGVRGTTRGTGRARYHMVAKRCAAALRASTIRCEGVNLFMNDGAAASQTIDHVHIHVLPRYAGDNFHAADVARVHADAKRLRIVAGWLRAAFEQNPE